LGQADKIKLGETDMFRAYFVDDEPLVLRDIINNPLFADYGYQTVGSSSMPLKAIAEIKKLNPDVVFTDLQMPECSGVDLIEKLRENGSDCEFVVISGYREFDESIRFFRLGGLDYILKPLKDEDLQQLLDKLTAKLAVKKSDESKQVDTSSSVLNEIIAYMKANIADKITLESISEAHHMTVPSICRLFHGAASPLLPSAAW
jgi:two-component system response regulator YesN